MKYLKIIPIAIIAISSYALNIKSEPKPFNQIPKPTRDGSIGYDYNENHYNYINATNATVPSGKKSTNAISNTNNINNKKSRKHKKVHSDSYYIIKN